MNAYRRPSGGAFRDDGARRALARRRRRRRVRRGAAWMVVAVLAVAAGTTAALGWHAGLGWVRTHTRIFAVRQVDVAATRWVPPWEIVERTGVFPGDDLLAVDPDSVAARVAAIPRVASVKVTRTWKRTVRVVVAEKVPVALLLDGRPEEVAADGTVLGPPPAHSRPEWPLPDSAVRYARGVELPLLTGLGGRPPASGKRLTGEGARQALDFLVRLRGYGERGEAWISEVRVERPGELVAVTLGGVSVRIGDGRLSRRKVEALLTVLERLRKDGKGVQYVDARFRNQVIIKQG